jgi:hypothetical protein
MDITEYPWGCFLSDVTSLDMSFDPHSTNTRIRETWKVIVPFTAMLVNLQEIDLSYIIDSQVTLTTLDAALRKCPNLQKITCNGSQGLFSMRGIQICNLKEFDLDCSELVTYDFVTVAENMFSFSGREHLFQANKGIERLSIKNITWKCIPLMSDEETGEPVTQEMLIKMVRNLPSLCWLKSDLSDENVAMLQAERPEITFVSE